MRKYDSEKTLPKYTTIEKVVGETPLQALFRLRSQMKISNEVPLAYAGRLDPMASGKILVLIGDECKKQTKYHGLDKSYTVEVLLGVSSDSGDVLGLIESGDQKIIVEDEVINILKDIPGEITLPYPHFSSKTVDGKPLHTWTLEGRIDEIKIPEKTSKIYKIQYLDISTVQKKEIVEVTEAKINSLPKVTDPKKHLGADFRRVDVRKTWELFNEKSWNAYQILSFECVASSGTYMRTLAEYISKKLGTRGLAYSIHRTHIGKYLPITKKRGVWLKKY